MSQHCWEQSVCITPFNPHDARHEAGAVMRTVLHVRNEAQTCYVICLWLLSWRGVELDFALRSWVSGWLSEVSQSCLTLCDLMELSVLCSFFHTWAILMHTWQFLTAVSLAHPWWLTTPSCPMLACHLYICCPRVQTFLHLKKKVVYLLNEF